MTYVGITAFAAVSVISFGTKKPQLCNTWRSSFADTWLEWKLIVMLEAAPFWMLLVCDVVKQNWVLCVGVDILHVAYQKESTRHNVQFKLMTLLCATWCKYET